MAKAVLTTKVRPAYDDLPEERYHFPQTYLNQINAAVGDEIIYYEPRRQDSDPAGREGRQAYIATARINQVVPDPSRPDHYYALIDNYIDFPRPVPFREGAHYYEDGLRKADGSTNKGAFGRAVRVIPDAEFDMICKAGLAQIIEPNLTTHAGLAEEPESYDRPIKEELVRRPFRDAVFARAIRAAYNSTCALTGLRLINGGGRTEMEAAHIRPVGDGHKGPDSVRNGIALCQTVHWMFDRGFISLADDYSLLMADDYIPNDARRLFRPDKRALVPENPNLRPHPQFLHYHRTTFFKGNR